MHPEAEAGFIRMVKHAGLDEYDCYRVLDIGGQNINGTVHGHLPNSEFTILDLENADIIADACTWVPDRQFDLVIATEVFEHVEGWPQIIRTARLALAPGGTFITTCAGFNRPRHGATGAPEPAPGEWYRNVSQEKLETELRRYFGTLWVEYLYPPGDLYAWARP